MVWLKHNLNLKGWNSHAHRGLPGKFESSNLSRDDMSREIGRTTCIIVCIYIYIYMHTYIYIYTHTHTHIHTHTHTHTHTPGTHLLRLILLVPCNLGTKCPRSFQAVVYMYMLRILLSSPLLNITYISWLFIHHPIHAIYLVLSIRRYYSLAYSSSLPSGVQAPGGGRAYIIAYHITCYTTDDIAYV